VAARVELVDRLSDCGFGRIEVGSFVSARRVPQMADAEQVFDQIVRRPGVEYSGLVLNLKGAQRALACDIDRLNCAVVATETFNMRNQGKAVVDTVAELDEVIALAARTSVPVTVTIAAAFGCPFEGPVAPSAVAALAAHFASTGAAEIALADTIGVGVPTQVQELFALVSDQMSGTPLPIGFHFHNTRNTGFANAFAALQAGASVLDASVGGVGGCPFAPAATGNIATEDLIYMLDGMGRQTGVDIDGVVGTAHWLAGQLGRELPGMVSRAGADWCATT
jgi:isopropylmalate/homocitrate/citramalate synthase